MTVLVVGGGITGLATAHALGRAGVPTMLVEASDRLGGKVRTERTDGFLVETGPDSFISYRPAGLELARELGLADAIVRPTEPRTVTVRIGGRFVALPDGMGLVLPTRLRPFVTTRMFSPLEKARMGLDLFMPRRLDGVDVAVGAFLRQRLGSALVDRLAGPLIGGVYGTPIDELSLDGVVPQLREAERDHRSLLLASLAQGRARRRGGGATGSPFVSLAGGVGQLTDALVDSLAAMPGVEVRTGTRVVGLDRSGAHLAATVDGDRRIVADGIVLAAPAPAAADLLAAIARPAASHLRSIPHGSTGVVTLAYRTDRLSGPLVGHGFLVADGEPLTISACTWTSNKWAGRAPDGFVLLRAFIGSSGAGILERSDEAVLGAVRADLATTMGIRGEPDRSWVSRFVDAMPHYTVGHRDRIAAVTEALAGMPGLVLAGAAYRGVGIPDCIAQGRAAAAAVEAHLGGGGPATDPSTTGTRSGDDGSSLRPLDHLPVGTGATVVRIEPAHVDELATEGLRPGVRIGIDAAAPLGGPLVVSVGRARVALARAVAKTILVEPTPGLDR